MGKTNKQEVQKQELTLNLHELNKAVINALPSLEEKRVKQLKKAISTLASDGGKYFMLLSNEKRDYTVFTFKDKTEPVKFANEVLDVLGNRGTIKEFDITEGGIEIWVNDTFYALFNYDLGVIEV